MIINGMSGGGGTNIEIAVSAVASLGDIPSYGVSGVVDFRIVSSVAVPSIESGGIMAAPASAIPSTRLDGSAAENGDVILVYASVGNTTVKINKVFRIRVIAVMQRQAGAWVRVPARVSDHGATFKQVNLLLYFLGDEFTDITNGWTFVGTAGKGIKNADNLYLEATGSSGSPTSTALFYTKLIDVTDLTTLHVLSKRNAATASAARLSLSTNIGTAALAYSNSVAYVTLTSNTTQTEQTLDVSGLTGSYYICLVAYTSSGAIGSYVYEVWSE